MNRRTSSSLLAALLLLILATGCGRTAAAPVARAGGRKIVSRASGRYFEVYDGSWKRHLVKGVNIGASKPGYWFGELAIDGRTYSRWLDRISRMKANTVLVYTLQKPAFYRALLEHNLEHPGRRLWLIQQAWPRDQGVRNDLYASNLTDEYRREISFTADALAGKADIPERRGLAWGKYTADVMPYVMGVLVGREITNLEVKETNDRNPGKVSHDGRFVRTGAAASPIEVWCAEMGDLLARRVSANGWTVPVGYVSWPTLDPLYHPTERTEGVPKHREVDDSQVLDPRHLGAGPAWPAGFFGMFQVYPYYPEFMYRQPSYADYSDESGVLRYGGYLRDFMEVIPEYPALVGEFGLPTSISSSHHQPEGLSQGNIEESAQGTELARMFSVIVREGYAGGLVFEWSDEWAKSNWVTHSYMIPFERHVLWHNATDPEQCFGLLAYESGGRPQDRLKKMWANPRPSKKPGGLRSISACSDIAFLYIGLEVNGARDMAPGGRGELAVFVGVSTLGRDHGTTRLPVQGVPDLPVGAEFFMTLDRSGSSFLCRPDYSRANSRFSAAPSTDATFEPVVYLTNRRQVADDGTVYGEVSTNQSTFRYGDFNRGSRKFNSLGNWYVDEGRQLLVVRIPWGLLNVSDPSSNRVILDDSTDLPPGPAGMRLLPEDTLETVRTPGFEFYVATSVAGRLADLAPTRPPGTSFVRAKAYNWRGWESPSYVEALKSGYSILRATYGAY